MKYFNPNDQSYIDAKLKDLFEAKCDICGTLFKRTKKFYYHRLYLNTFYTAIDICSPVCMTKSYLTGKTLQCKQCNKDIYVTKGMLKKQTNHFCGSVCAGIYNNNGPRRKKHSAESNNNRSVSMKKFIADHPDFNKDSIAKFIEYSKSRKSKYPKMTMDEFLIQSPKCKICSLLLTFNQRHHKTCGSKPCRSKLCSINAINRLKNPNRKIRGNGKQSYMEETFEKWLKETLDIQKGYHGYLTEVQFYNKKANKNGFCDFVFPQKRLIIELDGSHHIKRKHLDDIRDQHLNSRGWKVYRISIKEYYKQTKIEAVIDMLKSDPSRSRICIHPVTGLKTG